MKKEECSEQIKRIRVNAKRTTNRSDAWFITHEIKFNRSSPK